MFEAIKSAKEMLVPVSTKELTFSQRINHDPFVRKLQVIQIVRFKIQVDVL